MRFRISTGGSISGGVESFVDHELASGGVFELEAQLGHTFARRPAGDHERATRHPGARHGFELLDVAEESPSCCSPSRRARRHQRVQLRMSPVEFRGNLAQPALHGGDCAPEREVLVARRQGKRTDALTAEDGLHPLERTPRSHEHATDRIGVDADRHEHEAIAEVCPKSLAQYVDDRLVTGIEDERDRLKLEGVDLPFIELCELGDEWEQTAKRLDVARQNRGLGPEILDPRSQWLDQRHERLQLSAELGRRRRLDG